MYLKYLNALILTTLSISIASATVPPDCSYHFTYSNVSGFKVDNKVTYTSGPTIPLNNIPSGCQSWSFSTVSSGYSAVSISLESAPAGVSPVNPGTFVTFAGSTTSGSNPNSVIGSSTYLGVGLYPWIRANVLSVTGTGNIDILLFGWRDPNFGGGSSSGGPPTGAAGGDLSGTYPNPSVANSIKAGTPQIYSNTLIGQYAGIDATGSNFPDSSGNGNNGTIVGSPTVGPLNVNFSNGNYIQLPSGISAYKTVQIFFDGSLAAVNGQFAAFNYRGLVGSDDTTKNSIVIGNVNQGGIHGQVSVDVNGTFTTVSSQSITPLGMVSYVGGASTDHIYINGAETPTYASQGGTLSTIGGNIRLMGGIQGGGGGWPGGIFYYALFYSSQLTAAQIQQNYQAVSSILAKRGVVFPQQNTGTGSVLIPDGDSITACAGVAGGSCWWNNLTLNYTYTNVYHTGVGSWTAQACTYTGAWINSAINPLGGRNTLAIWLGTNDIGNNGKTAVQAHDYLASCAKQAQQAGWQVIVGTMLSRTGVTDSVRQAFNNLIRQNYRSYSSGVFDVGADPILGCTGCSTNTTYFQDGVHPTAAGDAIIAPIFSATINSLAYPSVSDCSALAAASSICGSSSSGWSTVAAAGTTFTVTTTAFGANSHVFFSYNTTKSGCTSAPTNVASLLSPYVSSFSAGVSFTATLPVAPVANQACVDWSIVGY